MKQKTKKPYALRIKELEYIEHLFLNLKNLPYELRGYKKHLSDEEWQAVIDIEKMCDKVAEKISTIQLFKRPLKQMYYEVIEPVKLEWMNGYFDSNNKDIIQVKNISDAYDAYMHRVPAWCWKDYDPNNAHLGKFYNGYSIDKKILQIPKGYRLPTIQDLEDTVALYKRSSKKCIENLQLKLEGVETISSYAYKYSGIYLFWGNASMGRSKLASIHVHSTSNNIICGGMYKHEYLPIKLVKETS